MKRFRGTLFLVLLIAACVALEHFSYQRLNPTGRFSTLGGYLAWRPSSQRFATTDVNGRRCIIAYGPGRSWLLLSSGPSAYVFDNTGRLVDWSSDIGDDSAFDDRWSAQRAYGPNQISRTQVQSIASTQPASG
jgi:hypothetical protein